MQHYLKGFILNFLQKIVPRPCSTNRVNTVHIYCDAALIVQIATTTDYIVVEFCIQNMICIIAGIISLIQAVGELNSGAITDSLHTVSLLIAGVMTSLIFN